MPSWKARPGHLGTWASHLGWSPLCAAAWGSWCWAPWGTWAMRGKVEKSWEILFWFLMQVPDQNRHKPRSKKCVCPCDSEAIWLYLCAVKPQRAWFCEFCRFAAEMKYYGIILQIITVSYQVWTSSLQMLFFRGSDGPHCEALLSCCHSLSSSPWHGEQYRAVQPCHAWLQVLFFFLRDHFSFLVHLGTSWYIPRSKRQSTTRWSVMIHDVDVADWPCIERSSDGTIPERRRRLIFLYIIRLRWQISD